VIVRQRFASSGLAAAICASLCACGSDIPTAPPTPTPTPIPACQVNHTGTLILGNSSSHSTMDVILNGLVQGTVSPGQQLPPREVAAAVAHTVDFRYTNSSRLACATSHPIIAQCSSQTINCSFDF